MEVRQQLLLIPGNPSLGQFPHQYAICMLMRMQVCALNAIQLLEYVVNQTVHLIYVSAKLLV